MPITYHQTQGRKYMSISNKTNVNVDLVAKPMGSGAVINEDADDNSAALTAPDPNERKVGAKRTIPDNETIVPKTREEYVAEFLQLFEKSAADQNDHGIGPVALTESEARREIEM